jgi:two-component system NtrC family sensor kinase
MNATPDLRLRRLVHELNTPVGVSTMATSMVPAQLDHLQAAMDPATRIHTGALMDELRETLTLVQSSLQLCVQILRNSPQAPARESAEALPLINLQETLQSALSIQLARWPDIQVDCRMSLADCQQVRGDSGAWQQVVGNLVANSLLHGFEGRSQGRIQIAGTRLPGNRLLLHYYDDGVGLSPQARAHLFEEGFSTRLGRGGHGLGMGIVRDLVQNQLGGRMDVHHPAQGVHISIEAHG